MFIVIGIYNVNSENECVSRTLPTPVLSGLVW